MNDEITQRVKRLAQIAVENTIKIATAESCTGGGIACAITDISGSSGWFDRGFVTYSNKAKVDMLAVNQGHLHQYGAVSEVVAKEMAMGAIVKSDADIAVSVTGIAGPSGGSIQKPVGTVYIGWQIRGRNAACIRYIFLGGRANIREQTIQKALDVFIEQCLIFNQ